MSNTPADTDALRPLIIASATGLHKPLLSRLSAIVTSQDGVQCRIFLSVLDRQHGILDVEGLSTELNLPPDLIEPFKQLLRRLQGGVHEDEKERTIREL
jgi:hypothetical protein